MEPTRRYELGPTPHFDAPQRIRRYLEEGLIDMGGVEENNGLRCCPRP